MVGGNSMGPGLLLVGARFLNFLLGKLSRQFKLRPVSIFHEIQMATFRYCVTSRKAITRVQTSPIVDTSRNSNDRISVVRDDTVTCLSKL